MGYSAAEAVVAGVLPFLPADLAKIAFAATAGGRVKRIIFAAGLLPSSPSGK